jgi:hypothetical protein
MGSGMQEQRGLLVCWHNAQRLLTSISATMALGLTVQGGLQDSWRIATR